MKTKETIRRARQIAEPFRVTKGKNFRLKDVDPNDILEFTKEEHKPRAKEALATGLTALTELQDKLYAQGQMGCAADLPGDGCGRQRWSHQARHVGSKSAGVPGLFRAPARASRLRLPPSAWCRRPILRRICAAPL